MKDNQKFSKLNSECVHNLQLLKTSGAGIGEVASSVFADGSARMEEVDPEVSVVALDRLRHVLHCGNVKWHRDSKDGQDEGLILLICNGIILEMQCQVSN